MDVGSPYRAVLPSLDGPVLRVLHGTTRPLTGREVHRLTGVGSAAGVQKVLARLAEQGLVIEQEAGSAVLVTANRDHLAWPAVDTLMTMRARLVERIADTVAGWTVQPVFVGLFGSAARGDGDVSSDVDVLVVRADDEERTPLLAEGAFVWDKQIGELRATVLRATGNHAQLLELTPPSVLSLVTASEPIVGELRRDLVTIAGDAAPLGLV